MVPRRRGDVLCLAGMYVHNVQTAHVPRVDDLLSIGGPGGLDVYAGRCDPTLVPRPGPEDMDVQGVAAIVRPNRDGQAIASGRPRRRTRIRPSRALHAVQVRSVGMHSYHDGPRTSRVEE